jgi:uncharacterized protein (DUF488 family)
VTIWTAGHSNRSIDEFLSLLTKQSIETLVDVRRFPGSRKYPHFNPDQLEASLRGASIFYAPIPELGGRRKPLPDSRNSVWRNDAFRGYADYMETPEYRAAADRLEAIAREKRTVVVCSEAVWWRCHRSMISDDLKSRGWTVMHLISDTSVKEHPYTAAARIVNGQLVYGDADE